MKKIGLLVMSFTVLCLFSIPLMAQHGQGGGGGMGGGSGMGQGMGQSMGHGSGSQPGSMGSHGQPGTEGTQMGHGPQMGKSGSTLSPKSPTNLLTQNTKLSSKLQSLLPAGTNLQDAASGFKNLGQFAAAVHVSHNLGIPFDELKTTMLSSGNNLGKAIQSLSPKITKKQAKSDAKTAEHQANQDIQTARQG
jgi:hypothetical protein